MLGEICRWRSRMFTALLATAVLGMVMLVWVARRMVALATLARLMVVLATLELAMVAQDTVMGVWVVQVRAVLLPTMGLLDTVVLLMAVLFMLAVRSRWCRYGEVGTDGSLRLQRMHRMTWTFGAEREGGESDFRWRLRMAVLCRREDSGREVYQRCWRGVSKALLRVVNGAGWQRE